VPETQCGAGRGTHHLADLAQDLVVGHHIFAAGLVALKQEGLLGAKAGLHVAVQRVVTDVGPAAAEPLAVDGALRVRGARARVGTAAQFKKARG
jgi:hypothetical protein